MLNKAFSFILRAKKRVSAGFRMRKLALVTSLLRLKGLSDKRRWSDPSNLSPAWDSRTLALAGWVEPGASVLEFGAGRKILRSYLPENCTYTPSDLVDRGDGTIVCDLNSDVLPEFPPHDVVVFSGVLEYVNDVPRLISHLESSCHIILASYAVSDFLGWSDLTSRRGNGWVNDYSAKEFEGIFVACGFVCQDGETWEGHRLYKFVRQDVLVSL